MFETMTMNCQAVRRPGSAALDLAYVACGRYDGYYEKALHIWDIAAGSLLVSEAGGIVADFSGESGFLGIRQYRGGYTQSVRPDASLAASG